MIWFACLLANLRTPNGGHFVRTRAAIGSNAAIDLDPPQYNNDGRHQRGQHQQVLQGSDPHFTLRFPSPISGVVDSLPYRQSFGHNPLNIGPALWFAGHILSPISDKWRGYPPPLLNQWLRFWLVARQASCTRRAIQRSANVTAKIIAKISERSRARVCTRAYVFVV